jgi:hypothetical protein
MTGLEKLRHFSEQEFAHFGMQDVAYVRAILVDDHTAFAIHAADGTQVAILPDRDGALATVRQHELEPLSVH